MGKGRYRIQKDFLKRNGKFYAAKISNLNFADPNAPNIINQWVKQKSKGKITKIIEQIDPLTVLFLTNAIYFNGKWQQEFDKAKTRDDSFFLISGKKKKVSMMSQSGDYNYLEGEDFQAVSLPYGKGRVSMYIFLPDTNSNLNQLLSTLKEKNWKSWLENFRERKVDIFLPRFKLEYEKSLVKQLKNLNMATAFNPDSADFSGMWTPPPKLFINEVLHKSFVDVNEEGIKAAAVTSIDIYMGNNGVFQFKVDRPFFFAICDNETGLLLFAGLIFQPM